MGMSTHLMRATTEMLILALLNDRASYGYELNRRAQRESDGTVYWGEGALYPALKRLRGKGLLTAQWSGPATGRRRKVYTLTAKGRRELAVRAAEWTAFTEAAESILHGRIG